MLPPYFKMLVEYFLVPLLVLCISYAISGQFNLKYSAGTDFFIFYLSADLGAIIEYPEYVRRINPAFREDYLAVFTLLVTVAVFLVIVAGLTQRKIEAWRQSSGRAKYPFTGVLLCWVATITLMPTHLFIFFGRI